MKTALSALVLLSLTACQAFPPGTGSQDESAATDDASAADDGAAAPGPDAGDGRVQRAVQGTPPKPRTLPPRPSLNEARLTGLTTNQAWDLLGPPSAVEQQSPATVWTYDVGGCRLDLFFYFDLESQEQRTLALDLESGSDSVGSRPYCWYALAKRGRRSDTGSPQAAAGGHARHRDAPAQGETAQ